MSRSSSSASGSVVDLNNAARSQLAGPGRPALAAQQHSAELGSKVHFAAVHVSKVERSCGSLLLGVQATV